MIEIEVRAGVIGRLTAKDQVNTLVKQGNAQPTVGYLALVVCAPRRDEAICKIPAQVGCGGRDRV